MHVVRLVTGSFPGCNLCERYTFVKYKKTQYKAGNAHTCLERPRHAQKATPLQTTEQPETIGITDAPMQNSFLELVMIR